MRIAIVTNFFPPIRTGSSNWARELAMAHVRSGDTVVVIAPSMEGNFQEYEENGYRIYRLPAGFRLPRIGIFMNFDQFFMLASPANYRRIKAILTKHDIEIVHQSNHLLDTPFLTWLICRQLDIPSVCTMMGRITHLGNAFYDKILKAIDRLFLYPMMHSYDAIISLAMETQLYAEKTYHHRGMHLFPLATLTAEQMAHMPVADPGRPLQDKELLIVSAGHVTENRNRLELIRALPALIGRGYRPRLRIAGKELTDKPRALAQALGVANYVEFLGEVTRERMFQLLSEAHIEAHLFAYPGLGCATQEAMAVGLPTLAYGYDTLYGDKVPLRDRGNIVFASPSDQASVDQALLALAENDDLRAGIGRAARKLVQDYLLWETVVEQIRGLCARLIRQGRHGDR